MCRLILDFSQIKNKLDTELATLVNSNQALFLFIDCLINLSHGLEFDPRLGYKIDDPEDFHHNGTYLCEFTDSGKGKKFSSLVIDLLVTAKKVTKTFVKVRQILLYYGTL